MLTTKPNRLWDRKVCQKTHEALGNHGFLNYFSDILTIIEMINKELKFNLVTNFPLVGG